MCIVTYHIVHIFSYLIYLSIPITKVTINNLALQKEMNVY